MPLTVNRADLLDAITRLIAVTERRQTVPILGHVLIEPDADGIVMSATDLDIGMRSRVMARGEMPVATLNAHKLLDVVKGCADGPITLNHDDGDWIVITAARARFKMMGLDPRSFPALPVPKSDGTAISLPAMMLAEMIAKTIFAVSPDEARYNLSGLYFESTTVGALTIVATDGHRLSKIAREIPGLRLEKSVIVPRRGCERMLAMLDGVTDDVSLAISGEILSLNVGGNYLSMRLVEGEFPDYRGVVPKSSKNTIVVGRDALVGALRRVTVFSHEKYHGIAFGLTTGTLTLSSTNVETGEAVETLDIPFFGEDMAIGFNSQFIAQMLAVVPSGRDIEIRLSDDVSPGTFADAADAGFTYVVMPMRL